MCPHSHCTLYARKKYNKYILTGISHYMKEKYITSILTAIAHFMSKENIPSQTLQIICKKKNVGNT